MTDYEKGIYSDMSVTDRILIMMLKVHDVTEFADLMIELGDGPAVKKTLGYFKKEK